MAYKALYRTYRPSTFEEVAGQQHIVKTLKNALQTGKIAHAYLFAGPRGTGKTTMAKIFAKALNCEDGIGNICNNCKNCISINDGTHPDVLELDAASNNGVDEIRALIDRVKYGTLLGKYKVYIIDEVHMLSTGAFNALLKTLEEPPENVVFILATTEPHKILPTILSRCQRYDFTKVGEKDIKDRIKVILEQEHIEYNEEAVNLIVSLCDGGMRDALSILDQILAYSGNSLNVEDILNIFSLESVEEKINLIKSIAKKDTADVLRRINNYFDKGSDIKRLTDDLLLILKDVLIYQGSGYTTYLEVLDENKVEELCGFISLEEAMKMVDILMSATKDFKSVTAINPLFEVTLLKMTTVIGASRPVIIHSVEEIKPVDKPVEKVQEVKEEEIPSAPHEITISDTVIYLDGTKYDNRYYIDDDTMVNVMVSSKKETKKAIMEKWSLLKKYTFHPQLSKAANLLIDAHPLVASSKILVIECSVNNIVEKVNALDNQKELQALAEQVFGNKMFVYAVNRNDSVKHQQTYMNLLQISKLPKAKDVILNFSEE